MKLYNVPLSLKIVCVITGIFFFIELIVGIISKSLALQADAIHMASDFISLIVAIYSKNISNKTSNNNYTFGYKRSEIVGAFANTIFLISSCIFISLEALYKFIDLDNAKVSNVIHLLIVGFIGLLVNIVGIVVIHFCSNTEHHHNHEQNNEIRDREGLTSTTIEEGGETEIHHISHNMKALFLHILGDLLGSIGVIISGFIMYYWEDLGGDTNSQYKYISDPISSLLIVIFILYSSTKLMKECIYILMEGSPDNINIDNIRSEILNIEHINDINELHIWSLCNDETCLTMHIKCDMTNIVSLLNNITLKLNKYKIYNITIQPDSL